MGYSPGVAKNRTRLSGFTFTLELRDGPGGWSLFLQTGNVGRGLPCPGAPRGPAPLQDDGRLKGLEPLCEVQLCADGWGSGGERRASPVVTGGAQLWTAVSPARRALGARAASRCAVSAAPWGPRQNVSRLGSGLYCFVLLKLLIIFPVKALEPGRYRGIPSLTQSRPFLKPPL